MIIGETLSGNGIRFVEKTSLRCERTSQGLWIYATIQREERNGSTRRTELNHLGLQNIEVEIPMHLQCSMLASSLHNVRSKLNISAFKDHSTYTSTTVQKKETTKLSNAHLSYPQKDRLAGLGISNGPASLG